MNVQEGEDLLGLSFLMVSSQHPKSSDYSRVECAEQNMKVINRFSVNISPSLLHTIGWSVGRQYHHQGARSHNRRLLGAIFIRGKLWDS